ncbi:DUF883 family protein [Kerstersia gyiorum]|jgi:ElaB/YqjD/DUF883 family membrane-anchored ribosome-binding protein|nr:DUF883 family protein [Kerstersia gyiorum]AZV94959.1 hypothetical protein CBF45_15595 [Bordetella sp. J329]KAB0544892.1 DUF883 family protein [Kerstersia gyiorum]MCH4270571.1 DUF883 family protein [Kerstersia gyiorum]MCI1228160.1 DUF883 family protein [Kerstersia gyiorum]MCR4157560.1 DUF883 family protein [Kerstersia gyiorum]
MMGILNRTSRGLEQGYEEIKSVGKRAGQDVQDSLREDVLEALGNLEAALQDKDADVAELRARLEDQIYKVRGIVEDKAATATQTVRGYVDSAEECIQAKPWQALGVVAAVSFLLGALITRR